MRRHLLLLLGFAAAGWLFGLADSYLPAPRAIGVFWIGNISSFWVVLPFLAGWAQRSWGWAAITGALAAQAAIVGFYLEPDLHLAVGFVIPWLLIAGSVGPAYGLLGALWGRSRALIAGIAIGLPFVVEPLLWWGRYGHLPRPFPVWIVEAMLGVGLLAWVSAARARRA